MAYMLRIEMLGNKQSRTQLIATTHVTLTGLAANAKRKVRRWGSFVPDATADLAEIACQQLERLESQGWERYELTRGGYRISVNHYRDGG